MELSLASVDGQAGGARPPGGVGGAAPVQQEAHSGQVDGGELAVGGVVGLDDGEVDLLPQVVGGPAEGGQLVVGVHGVVDERLGAGRAQGLHDGEDAGEGGLLHAPAVRGAQHHGAQARQRAEGPLGAAHRVGGHGGVEGAGGAHHRGVGVGGQVQARVDGDAVPAHRDAGAVDVGVGLGVAGLDDALDVEAGPVGVDGELVGQADIDVAVGGLGLTGRLINVRALFEF